ncbi:MAG: DUF4012 domain-containing protein [Candidatus Nanopelagicales bacterium]|nr:DUF4012 domain-containing protein [Candidatus Nanopelagicales bacterium]MDZ4248935.1 DUF4012 domain-containing protein [Candidatus Nanopelagicales bacterium]
MRRKWWVLGGVAVLVALMAWAGYEAISAARSTQALQTNLTRMRDLASDQDTTALAAELPTLRSSALDMQAAANRPMMSALSVVPLIGPTVSSLRDLADASADVAGATTGLDAVLPALAPDQLYQDGRANVDAIRDASPALAELSAAVATAEDRVRQADPGSLGPVGPAVQKAQDELADLSGGLKTAAQVTDILPSLLGADGPSRWAILLQNGSEARGTGGFLGAYALLRADDGQISIGQVDTNNSLKTKIPTKGMPAEFIELWTKRYTSDWRTYNLSRHFPYTGELTRNGMAVRGDPIDNVLAMDAHVVAALLAGTGPVTAAGVTIDSSNAERFFNADVYVRFPDVKEKDAAVVELMTAVLDKVLAGPLDLPSMVSALSQPVQEGRLLAWSSNASVQETLQQWPVASIVPESKGPWTSVSMNDSSASKLDAFIQSSVRYEAASCGAGTSTVRVTLTNNAPAKLAPYADPEGSLPSGIPGRTGLSVSVYGPVGAEYGEARLDGKRQFVRQGFERGHPVWGGYDIVLKRGQTRELVLTFTEPTSPGTTPTVLAQAMPIPQTVSATTTGCG